MNEVQEFITEAWAKTALDLQGIQAAKDLAFAQVTAENRKKEKLLAIIRKRQEWGELANTLGWVSMICLCGAVVFISTLTRAGIYMSVALVAVGCLSVLACLFCAMKGWPIKWKRGHLWGALLLVPALLSIVHFAPEIWYYLWRKLWH
jgi:hypothetical protein